KPFSLGKQNAVRQGNTKNTRVFVRQVGMSIVYPGCKHIPEFLRRAGVLLPAERPQQARRSMSGEPLSRDRRMGIACNLPDFVGLGMGDHIKRPVLIVAVYRSDLRPVPPNSGKGDLPVAS